MDEVQERLVRCFSLVFPQLTPDQIRSSSVQTVLGWDSLAAVTLVAVLQEEFAVEIDFGDLPELESFDSVLRYLGSRKISGNVHN
jgi:acyl carrier protein